MTDLSLAFKHGASGYICWRRSKDQRITSRDRRFSIAPDPVRGYQLTDHRTTGVFTARTQDDCKRIASQLVLRELTGA